MKRVVSIIVILLLTLTAVQPSVVFHFCKGKLHSVGIVKGELPPPCCGEKHKNCCSNEILKIATDDFQIQQDRQMEIFPLVVNPVLFIINDYFFTWDQSQGLSQPPPNFPPGGLARHNIDLLTLICIYRI